MLDRCGQSKDNVEIHAEWAETTQCFKPFCMRAEGHKGDHEYTIAWTNNPLSNG